MSPLAYTKGIVFGVISLQNFQWSAMKRICSFLLLLVLGFAALTPPLYAQRMSPEESERQSRKAAKTQQKMLHKKNKKQAKVTRKFEKAQRKQTKKANRDLAKRQQSSPL